MLSQPHTYPRRILLAIIGRTPQLLTETLYALAVEQQPAFIPTEVHVITTEEGKERTLFCLLDPAQNWFAKLREDYQLPPIRFVPEQVHVFRDENDVPLKDVQTLQDNEYAANTITDLMRELTGDPQSAVHVSISGGRRTMTFYGGYALSLFGRQQDRLSHILVEPPDFQFLPDFYYPTPETHIVFSRAPEVLPLNAADAKLILADMPFVRLRQHLPANLREGKSRFTEAIAAVQADITPVQVQIDLPRRRLQCGSAVVPMTASPLAFYAWFAWRAQQDLPPISWREADAEEYLSIHARISDKFSLDYQRAEKALENGFSNDYFDQRKAKMHSSLKKHLGEQAEAYLLKTVGKRPFTKVVFGVGQVEIIG